MTELIEKYRQNQFFHDRYSKRAYLAHALGRRTFKPVLGHFPLIYPTFKLLDAVDYAASLAPTDSRLSKTVIKKAHWRAHLFVPKKNPSQDIIVYFHGGAFLSCGLGTHKQFMERLALKTSSPVFAVDYRQYPEAYFASSVQDCVEAVEFLLEEGYAPEQISLAGDSAGGGLALKVAGIFLARGLVLKSVVALSGWLDFSTTYEEYRHWARRDAYIPARRITKIAEMILGHKPLPEHSPIYDLKPGYPPLLLIVGANEILRVDSEKAYAKCVEEDLDCTLHYFSGGVHAFPVATELFPEAARALELVKDFLVRVEITDCE